MLMKVTFEEVNQNIKTELNETNEGFSTFFDEIALGRDGEDGLSAYQIACNNGFVGTEEAWLQSLHGRDGVDGRDGRNGVDGKDGYTPVKGVDYFDGKDGINGKDGEAGYTPIKGIDYFDGKDGANGRDGQDGKAGLDGKTPVKGVDYYTETDKAEMVSIVIASLPVYDGEAVKA